MDVLENLITFFFLYFSLNVNVITSRRRRWSGHAACVGDLRNNTQF
jgi:hypothetical protein